MKPGRQSNESRLLSKEEHGILVTLLGVKCESLATSVVQLFLTDTPKHNQWKRKDAGVMCLVKDHLKRSYFFRLFCVSRRTLLWENELYNNLEYTAPRVWLHTFEADQCMAAFNFADEEEAKFFQNAVKETLVAKKQRRMERRSRTSYQMQGYQGSVPNLSSVGPTYNHQNGPINYKHQRSTSSGGGSKKKESKRKFTKADIGLPQDFRHISHVGWDPNKGFDGHGEALVDPQLKEFFVRAGVSDNQLRDPETREFIYDFIEAHGGLASVKDDVLTPPRAPPVPSRCPPPQAVAIKPSPPPPPSVVNAQSRNVPPPASHQRTAPPPPPPPPMSTLPKPADVDTSRNIPAPPPPPPPPPMMSEPAPAVIRPSPAAAAAAAAAPDHRSALMDAIKSQPALKHVDVTKRTSSHSDSRGELLDQIRQGVELKSVQVVEKPTGPQVPLDGLAGALARALAERSRAFHNDSDSESESEAEGDSDSEWEE